ncbi:MAG: hypothetical protein E6G22_10160 [Actinobacteria bacterium]|nr:MAG: hypothetical protein E6G22_10160 [Actinomycetota bacterium]
MAENEHVRLEIAFDGGQITGALVSVASADELERALSNGADGTVALDATDGKYLVPLRRVVYVKRFARESHVGFSG